MGGGQINTIISFYVGKVRGGPNAASTEPRKTTQVGGEACAIQNGGEGYLCG